MASAHALAGRFDEADAIAKALINLGEATSSTRARSLGYGVASLASYLRGSETAAIATNLPAQGLGGFVPMIEQELRRLD